MDILSLKLKKDLTSEEMEFLYKEVTARDVVLPPEDTLVVESQLDALIHRCSSYMSDVLACKEVLGRVRREYEKLLSNRNNKFKVSCSELFNTDEDVRKRTTNKLKEELVHYKLKDLLEQIESLRDKEGDLRHLVGIADDRYKHLKSIVSQLRRSKSVLEDRKRISRLIEERGRVALPKQMPEPPTLSDVMASPVEDIELDLKDLEPDVKNKIASLEKTELRKVDSGSIDMVDTGIPDDLFADLFEEGAEVAVEDNPDPQVEDLDPLVETPAEGDAVGDMSMDDLPGFLKYQKEGEETPSNGNKLPGFEEEYDFDALLNDL